MIVTDEPAEVASLNIDAKPWSPPSSGGVGSPDEWGAKVKETGSADDDNEMDDVVIKDPFAENANFSWGMQALTGMAVSMFPDEDEKSPHSASPAISLSPRGKEPLIEQLTAVTAAAAAPASPPRKPPPRSWSPTISHTLLNTCPRNVKNVEEGMESAYRKLKMEIAFSSKLESVAKTREAERKAARAKPSEDSNNTNHTPTTVEEQLPEAKTKRCEYNEEKLLRLHKTGGIPAHELPSELFIGRRQEPELTRKYPTLLNPNTVHNHSHSNNHHHHHQHYAPVPVYYDDTYKPHNGVSPKWKKEPCRYYAQGGKCRKADCPFYHDPNMFSGEMQAAYEMELMKQAQMERDYTILLNDVLNQEMVEKQRDASEGVKSGDRTVYIVGIDSSTSDENILIRLSHFGSIRKYQLCGDPNQPTRYGFFEYNTVAAARGCQTIDCKKMFTRPIRVSKAKDAIKGGRNIPEMHQMELLRAAVMCQIQNIEAPCVKGTGRPATILDEPTPPPGKNSKRGCTNGHEGNSAVRPQSPQKIEKSEETEEEIGEEQVEVKEEVAEEN
eukprot:TRINITY_DN464_c1_g2_i1.p1 TRINITY_DN464_c1_g2~~TRINITY_DN464_c1_g2_i1.p1  ORF type:complete len:555 (+),score=136.60 TRINITY_DN464_c1_g2_i1:81-1745(+)